MFKKNASIGFIVLAAAVSPVSADLNPGDSWTSPFPPLAGTNYTAGLPTWLTVANLVTGPYVGAMTNQFTGTVTSWVYDLNGGGYVPGVDKLGFVYQFAVTNYDGGTGLERAAFADANWNATTVTDAGSDQSGTSTKIGVSGWMTGEPAVISRQSSPSGAPVIDWVLLGSGTNINKPTDLSAVIWFETDAIDYGVSHTGLLDSGKNGDAKILAPVPAPGAVLLGMLGFGLVGWIRRRFA